MLLDIALAQFQPSKGDPEASFARLPLWFERIASMAEARDTADEGDGSPRLAVFPEAAATGYFLEGGVRERALPAEELLSRLAEAWRTAGAPGTLDVAFGFYEELEGRLYNSALYAELGPGDPRLVHVHRKVFLPTYGVFQEERFVEAGDGVRAFDTRWGRAALLICEDFWHPTAARAAVRDGAGLLIVPSASPARGTSPGPGMPGNLARWERLARSTARELGVVVAISQLVGFEGGKGFAGGSLLCNTDGTLVEHAGLWEESLDRARVEVPARGELRPGRLKADDEADGDPGGASAALRDPAEALERGYGGAEFSEGEPHNPALLEIDGALVEDWLVHFLRDETGRRRGFQRAVVGMSGGVDSSVTAALCARAFGPANVDGFVMPYATSSPESAAHAALVAQRLGIDTRTIDITAAVDGYLAEHEPDASPMRCGNVMARTRMIVLFDQASKLHALPVGTGNKSERLLGYFTWHADDSPPINPLGDLFKTQVWALARHLGLPDVVIEKPASADLVRGQTDEADLGISYTEADLILLHLLEGRSIAWLENAGFAPDDIRTVRHRLESTHWKRNLPTVAMLSSTTIGEWYLRPVDY